MATESAYDAGLKALKAGKYAEARKLFDDHEVRAGTAARTRELLDQGEARLQAGEVGPAAAAYEAALERNPGLPETYFGLTRIALFTGKVDAARVHATAATKLAPTLALAWTMLGLVFEADKDLAGALPMLLEGAKLGPDSFLCQYNAGRLMVALQLPEKALPFLTKAAELSPKSPDVHGQLGHAHKQLKQVETALKSFEKSRDLAPTVVESWATLGDVLFELKEFAAAKKVLDAGMAANGDHPVLLEKALACTMMLNQVDAAIHYVERELKIVPDHEQGWLNLAGLYLLNKDFARSELVGKQLVAKFPKSWEGWTHLGNLYEAVPKQAEAEDAYRKAVTLAPKQWKPLTNFGALLVQTNDAAKHAEAKKLLEQAVAVAPAGEHRPRYNLALALVRLGDKKKAHAIAKELAPVLPDAKKLEENLRGA